MISLDVTDLTDLEETTDNLGGYEQLSSDLYLAKVKACYEIQSKGGAIGIVVQLNLPELNREYSETIYITNREKKPFYISKDNKKMPLPGYTTINDLCMVASGKGVAEQPEEEKQVLVYDLDQKREIPKAVPVLVDLLGKTVVVGITKTRENKTALVNGKYEPTAQERISNNINKVFYPDNHKTVPENRDGKEAVFWDKWLKKYKDQVIDKYKEVADTPKKSSSSLFTTSDTPKSGTSLFNK